MPVGSPGRKPTTRRPRLKAPFPYIGGKGRVAHLIWGHLGDVRNYIEPFCGSAAVLLARPHPGRIETVSDVNCFVPNALRAMSLAPQEVARHADWPVSEADLHARHLWLMTSTTSREFRERMRTDPDYFDARIAGWWIWGACCWIGSGWCAEMGDRGSQEGTERRVMLGGYKGQLGRGVKTGPTRKRPALSLWNSEHGRGVHADARPQLADRFSRGRGVHGNDGASTCSERRAWLVDWMTRLSDRLRSVRSCCGDWARVCSSPSVTTRMGLTGIFLDPPYALDIERMHAWVEHLCGQAGPPAGGRKATSRDANLYASDRDDVDRLVASVHLYCRHLGAEDDVRIVLAGYEGEHEALEGHGWESVAWKGSGYGNRGPRRGNAARERLWISPHCLRREAETRPMYPIWEDSPHDR